MSSKPGWKWTIISGVLEKDSSVLTVRPTIYGNSFKHFHTAFPINQCCDEHVQFFNIQNRKLIFSRDVMWAVIWQERLSVLATDKRRGLCPGLLCKISCLSFLTQSFIISNREIIIYIYNYYHNMITVLSSHIKDTDIIVVGWAISPLH